MLIGERIKALRETRGWTTADLERRSGVSRDQLSRIQNNHHKPSWGSLVGISLAFGMDVRALVEGVEITDADLPDNHPQRQKGARAAHA